MFSLLREEAKRKAAKGRKMEEQTVTERYAVTR